MVELINKEEINTYAFVAAGDTVERKELEKRLHLAMVMSNDYQNKVKIIFNTSNGPKSIMTTIWAKSEKNIILKGGVFIPLLSIAQVIL